jgi:hypothetical protein
VTVDASHPHFADPAALEAGLARIDSQQPAEQRPRGSFNALPQSGPAGGGTTPLQGHVWATSGVAGVWATRDATGHLTEVVFWTVIAGDVRVEELAAPAWGRRSPGHSPESALVAEAAAWHDRQVGRPASRVTQRTSV